MGVALRSAMDAPKLRKRVITSIKSRFAQQTFGDQLRWMADNYRSFEGWLNWEVAYAFSRANPWPDFTAERESRYTDGCLADVRFYAGKDEDPACACHLETKLIWNNGNRSKMIAQAAGDAKYLSALGGANLLLAVTVSANAPKDDLESEPTSSAVMGSLRKRLDGVERSHRVLNLDTPKDGPKYYVYPRINAALFEIG